MPNDFYRAFEEQFYAPRETIKALRRQYLNIVEPLRHLFPGASVFDVGCGRGEWLELMLEAGFAPFGVDLDDGMLSSCFELALPAKKGDAIEYLESLPDESHALVTAFHVAEHVSFDQLKSIFAHSLRTLKSGGLLIMETPNPENLVVATHNFYLDPTHCRPLPAPLLAFLAKQAGFGRVATIKLQESARIRAAATPSLYEVLGGVSPDVALIAQKEGLDPAQEALFDFPFENLRGVGLWELAERYDVGIGARVSAAVDGFSGRMEALMTRTQQLDGAIAGQQQRSDQHVEAVNAQVATLADEFSDRMEALMTRTQQLDGAIAAQQQRSDQHVETVNAQVAMLASELAGRLDALSCIVDGLHSSHLAQMAALQAERDALRASWSWRITAPLRSVARPLSERATRAHEPSPAGVSAALRPMVVAMKQVLRDPQRSYRLNKRLMRYPAVHRWLVDLSKRAGIYPGPPSTARFRDAARHHAAAGRSAVHVAVETPGWARQAVGEPNVLSDGTAPSSVLARPLVLTGRDLDEAFEELRELVAASSEAAALRRRAVSSAGSSSRGSVA